MSDMPPQDERTTTAYKTAKLAVIILTSLIILALIALVAGGIAKMSGKPAATGLATAVPFMLPRGSRILEMQSQPGRLLLHVKGPGGEAVEIIDIQDGHLVGTVRSS